MKLRKKSVFDVINQFKYMIQQSNATQMVLNYVVVDLSTRWILRALNNDRGFYKYFFLILINSFYSFVISECMAYQKNYFNTQSLCPINSVVDIVG